MRVPGASFGSFGSPEASGSRTQGTQIPLDDLLREARRAAFSLDYDVTAAEVRPRQGRTPPSAVLYAAQGSRSLDLGASSDQGVVKITIRVRDTG